MTVIWLSIEHVLYRYLSSWSAFCGNILGVVRILIIHSRLRTAVCLDFIVITPQWLFRKQSEIAH